MVRSHTRGFLPKFYEKQQISILKAIVILAHTYSIAKSSPDKYAKYDFDFPEMIKAKLMNLHEPNLYTAWINAFSSLLLQSIDSPNEVLKICNRYLRELYSNNDSSLNRKESSHARK